MKFGPFVFDEFEILAVDLLDLPLIPFGHIKTEGFFDVKMPGVQPIFAFFFGLPRMDMDGLSSFVTIEEESPAHDKEDRRHNWNNDRCQLGFSLRDCALPLHRLQPYFGNNIKKLRGFKPETWRYRIGAFRFFYEIDDERKIVFMLAAEPRSKSY